MELLALPEVLEPIELQYEAQRTFDPYASKVRKLELGATGAGPATTGTPVFPPGPPAQAGVISMGETRRGFTARNPFSGRLAASQPVDLLQERGNLG